MSEWISVEDRLPDTYSDFLVWCGWHQTAIYQGDGVWKTEDNTIVVFHVTHWMPLPGSPKEGE